MKIIILGAGRVGRSLAENLINEGHDITIIDVDNARLADLGDRLELRMIIGDAINTSVLREAGAAEADMLLACTSSDATNLVSCKVGQQVFSIPMRIARLRSAEYQQNSELLDKQIFAVDGVICPERLITKYLKRLVQFPAALEIRDFCQGLACLISMKIEPTTPMANKSITEIYQTLADLKFNIVAIYRRFRNQPDHLISCDGSTVIQPNDEVFILIDKAHASNILAVMHGHINPVRRVTLAGGGKIAKQVAEELHKIPTIEQIKIIEEKKEQCNYLVGALPDDIIILNGNANDEDLLIEENVAQNDLLIAVTEHDEDNIMSCLQAKKMGAKRVITLLNRHSYADLMHGTQIDIALAPAQIMMDELLTFVRTTNIKSIYSLRRSKAEAIEIVAIGHGRTSKVVGKKISELKLPIGASIGLIGRNLPEIDCEDTSNQLIENNPEIIVAHPNYIIQTNDHIVLFLPDKKKVPTIEKLFIATAISV